MITAGIDLGTAAIKVVFIDKCNLLWAKALPTMPQYVEISEKLLEEGLESLSIREKDLAGIAATGYGKRLFPNAGRIVDEISANAAGAYILSDKTARTVINIGGQDVKVIKLSSDGKVIDFKMNDKCAAGTGRFFEMAEKILNIPVREFGKLGLLSQSPAHINSTCTVFAESEIMSLLSVETNTHDIIAGLHKSVARRISDLAGSLYLEEEIYLDGGPGANRGLVSAMQEELMRDIKVFPIPQFTVAFGAAAILSRKNG
ncbi:hypothetical protein KKC91_09820 [bacterium]|nr:hypothetical protein [bacterium]